MSTSDEAGYSGRLQSSTRPIQEAQGEGRQRSRSRESRRGEYRNENDDDNDSDNTSQPQGTPTDGLDLPVYKEEAENPYGTRGHLDAKYRQPRGSATTDLLSLDRAPPPTVDVFTLVRAPPSELRRPVHPCRPLGLRV